MAQARDEILTQYTGDTRGFARAARFYENTLNKQERLTNDRLTRIDRRLQRSSRTILSSTTALTGLTAALAVHKVREYAEAWRSVERRLQSIGQSSPEATQGLIDLALRTRSVVGATADAVQRMAKSTGADLATTTRRVETLQKLLAVGGASGSERASVSLQLGQALKSGKLSGDEFRSISENAPVEFLDALAEAAGITRRELKDFAQDQKLTTDIVLQALDSLAVKADSSFSQMAMSGEEAVSVLSTGLTAYVGRVDESLGATATLNGAMVNLGEYLSQSGEGAENMAAALQILAVGAATVAGSRGFGGMTRSLRAASDARKADVAASQKQLAASRQLKIDLTQQLARAKELRRERQNDYQQRVFADKATKNSKAQLTAAIKAEEKATLALAGAHERLRQSSDRVAAAQKRLQASVHVTATAMRGMRSIMAFFGGPIGLALTAFSLLAVRLGSVKSAGEQLVDTLGDLSGTIDRETKINETLLADYEALRVAKHKLADASAAGGEAARTAAAIEVDAINTRIQAHEAERNEIAILRRHQLNEATRLQDEMALAYRKRYLTQAAEAVAFVNGGGAAERQHMQQLRQGAAQNEAAFRALTGQYRALLEQKVAAGEELSKSEKAFLEEAAAAAEAEQRIADLEAAVAALTAEAPNLSASLGEVNQSLSEMQRQAAAAQQGIAGLMAVIPELNRAHQVHGKLAKAQSDRDAALAGLGDQSAWGPGEFRRASEINDLFRRATSEIDGSAEASRRADKALKDYLDQTKLRTMDARAAAYERERIAIEKLETQLRSSGATQEEIQKAQEAYAARVRELYEDDQNGPRKVGGGAASTQSQLAELRELLVESGQRQLYVEAALNEERVKLRALLPDLISLGLSRAEAEQAIEGQLQKTEAALAEVRSAEQERAYQFARNMLEDLRSAENLTEAIGGIANRLMDLARDKAFDLLANQFARLLEDSGLLGQVFGAVFGSAGSGGSFNGSASGGGGGVAIAGARAKGGAVRKGAAYLVNEDTPRSEVMVAPANGAILNVAQAQQALAAAAIGREALSAASRASVSVNVAPPQIHIHNNAAGVRVREQRTGPGRTDIFIEGALNSMISDGRLDTALRGRFNLKPTSKGG